MRFQKQAFRHKPEEGTYGDCTRTCLANVLDLDRDSVPNFGIHYENDDDWNKAMDAWLATQGLKEIQQAYDLELEPLLTMLGYSFKDTYYLLGGKSKNGTNHNVVCCGDKIVCDPSLDNPDWTGGLVGPMSTGYYHVSILVPRILHRQEEVT